MADAAFSFKSNDHYEQACDQAIAMCGGNMRGAIKALIMANEYLEMEMAELQARILLDQDSPGYAPRKAGG